MRLLRTMMTASTLQSVDFVFIFQSDYRFISDSEITFTNLECPKMHHCESKDEHSISGTFLQFDDFVVNTFTFLGDEDTFVAIGVDNFGFIVMDLITGNIVEEVPFIDYYPHLPKFSILKLVNIANTGIRILLANGNAFSFIWDNLRRVGDGSIFEAPRASTSFLDISGDYSSPLIQEIDGIGVAQLVYYRQSNGFTSAFVRIYNSFNRVNSKVFQEFSLGTVRECDTLSVIDVDKGISMTCGPNLILLRISIYPFLQINATNAAPLSLEIDVGNHFSNTKLIVNARNNNIGSNIPGWLLLLIFMCGLIVLLMVIQICCNLISKKKDGEESSLMEDSKNATNKSVKASDESTDEASSGSTLLHTTIRTSFNAREVASSIFGRNDSASSFKSNDMIVMEYDDEKEEEQQKIREAQEMRINNTMSIESDDSLAESVNTSRQNRFNNLEVIEEEGTEDLYKTGNTCLQ